MEKINILGININNVNMEEALEFCINAIANKDKKSGCTAIYTPNSEMLVEAVKDRSFEEVLLKGDLLVPDGIGLIKAARFYRKKFKEKVAGTKLAFSIMEEISKKEGTIFILGGKSETTKLASERAEVIFPGIKVVGSNDGYFDEEFEPEIVEKINLANPDFLLVCLGMKKQELFINRHKEVLNVGIAIGLGGTVNIMAGTANHAPDFFVKYGLEWFYRLVKEPRRIIRMLNLPRFLVVAFADSIYNSNNKEI